MNEIIARYQITCSTDRVEQVCRDIALEQTVEVPEAMVAGTVIEEEVVGRVISILPLESDSETFEARIAYRAELACDQLPQLLNLVYGNISIKTNIKLVKVELPESLLSHLRGPKLGVTGLRQLTGIYGRPLLATALKPRGAAIEKFAAIAEAFALGGGDLIKDDHNLVETNFESYRERVLRCRDAVKVANEKTGRNTLYFPNLSAPLDQLDRYLEMLLREGIPGYLIAPQIAGLEVTRHLTRKYPLAVMAHPTFSGVYYQNARHGIAPDLLLGTVYRLAGCDISIYPNYGGRFTLSRAECLGIKDCLGEPLGSLQPSLPAPAGGMKLERIPSMADEYGADTVYLIGGGLLGHSQDLRSSTSEFLDHIRTHFSEELIEPKTTMASACDWSGDAPTGKRRDDLEFNNDYTWKGRSPTAYKSGDELPFREVSRHELIGSSGEDTAFDLRYFEIGPGGYSSLEKHLHTHTIVCIRGSGVLCQGDQEKTLKPFDIAYVGPLEVHQLRNEAKEPFGFFCIVDHDRDRPMPP